MKTTSRPLSVKELGALPPSMVDRIDLTGVKLIDAHHPVSWLSRLIGRGGLIVVRGRHIFWPHLPPDLAAKPEWTAILAHELTHVWQYQTGMTLWKYLWRERGRYRYKLKAGTPFEAYGYEQQAAMVEDWVRLMRGLSARYNSHCTAADLAAIVPFLPHGTGPNVHR